MSFRAQTGNLEKTAVFFKKCLGINIEYKISVARFKEKVNEKERIELKEKLKRHKEEFERIYGKTKSQEIKKAIEVTEINGGQVEGESEEGQNGEQDGNR